MRRALFPIFLLLGACAQLNDGPPGGGPLARGAATTSIADQQQVLLRETATKLKLTPRQLVLWERYQDRAGALLADQLRADSPSTRRLGALQQIDSRVATVRHRLAAIEEVQDAAAAVYESLDAEQQKIADRRLAATVPPLYSGLITCFTAEPARDRAGGGPGAGPGGAPPPR